MDAKKEYRGRFVKKILEVIPSYLNPAEYLTEVLDISKVSAYRRLNCTIPFSYDETVKLSSELNFSLDEIVCRGSGDKAIFIYQKESELAPRDFFTIILEEFYDTLIKEPEAKTGTTIVAMNHVWFLYALGSDLLLKFFYYKWSFRLSSLPVNYLLRNVELPYEALVLRDKICRRMQFPDNTVFILDRFVYLNTIKEIQYYYRRKLINKDELLRLREELEYIIKFAQMQMAGGTYAGMTHHFYLSYLNVYSNSIYIESEDDIQSFFYECSSIKPFKSVNPGICETHKKWLESLKKDSVLISASNEMLQTEFFRKQNEYLECLVENKDPEILSSYLN